MHDIDNKNGNVAEGRATGSKVGEGLVTRRVDDQQTRDLELQLAVGIDDSSLLLDSIDREVRGTDLLGDTSRLAFLNIGLSNLVEQLRLACIDVSQNTADGGSQVVLGSGSEGSLVVLLTTLCSFLLALGFSLLRGGNSNLVLGITILVVIIIIVVFFVDAVAGTAIGLRGCFFIRVGIPTVLDIVFVSRRCSLPVFIKVAPSSGLLCRSLGLCLSFFFGSLFLSLLGGFLGLNSSSLSGRRELCLFINLPSLNPLAGCSSPLMGMILTFFFFRTS